MELPSGCVLPERGRASVAGNTVVANPSFEVSRATLTLAALFEEAGLPPGVRNVVPGDGERAGAALAGHRSIEGRVFTEGLPLDGAVAETVGNMTWNCGQWCGQRSGVYVHKPVYGEFVSRLENRLQNIVVGVPDDPATQLGPAANPAQYRKLYDYIERGRAAGARELFGPGIREDVPKEGFFVPPTV